MLTGCPVFASGCPVYEATQISKGHALKDWGSSAPPMIPRSYATETVRVCHSVYVCVTFV